MARADRSTDVREPTAARDRLDAMGLRARPLGWVPEPPTGAAPEPVTAESPADPVLPPPSPASPTVTGLARAWLEDRLPLWAPNLLDRVSRGTVVAAVVVLAAVGLVGVMLLHRQSAGGYSPSYEASATGSSYSADPVVSAAPGGETDSASIVVDVGGRVRKPGLVTLPAGARVADALAAAGGPLHHKDIATLDLAARVSDGQLLLIGATSQAGGGDTDGTATDGSSSPVSLSSATIDELETLPGVGPVTAQKIIDWRTAHNGFATVESLQEVSGIGPAKYAELSPLVTP